MNESKHGQEQVSPSLEEEVFRTDDFFEITIERGEHLMAADLNGFSDPYVKVILNDHYTRKTQVRKKTLNPLWNEVVRFYRLDGTHVLHLKLEVYDWDRFTSDDFIGRCELTLSANEDILPDQEYSLSLPLRDTKSGTIYIKYKWIRDKSNEEVIYSQLPSIPGLKYDMKFGATFIPCVPEEYFAITTNKDTTDMIFMEVFHGNIAKDELTVMYHKMDSSFEKVADSFIANYLKHYQLDSEKKGSFKMLVKPTDYTSTYDGEGKFKKIIQTAFHTTSKGKPVNVIFLTCNYEDKVMLNFICKTREEAIYYTHYALLQGIATHSVISSVPINHH
ncbi:hypothetical protein C9374_011260 [Naegleria lovaniensis]|uniref:C2 domain-containing protein n=1 Tax=Naegleria lovaniensis TaxID=51637 RepID=A0AA88H0D4_NAELO|nr:uncharacterized protein C9374_011260 [Naegleria lovaniensis]KAG2392535.1 hypothetical protein C9374_011260 [Naegleria lovaniensis]